MTESSIEIIKEPINFFMMGHTFEMIHPLILTFFSLQEAIALVEPLMNDPVNYVRQVMYITLYFGFE